MRSDAGIKMSRADMKMYNLYKFFNRLMREEGQGVDALFLIAMLDTNAQTVRSQVSVKSLSR